MIYKSISACKLLIKLNSSYKFISKLLMISLSVKWYKKILCRVKPCCAGLISIFLFFEKSVTFLREGKKCFWFISLSIFMHNIVTDDARNWWLHAVFVKAKM